MPRANDAAVTRRDARALLTLAKDAAAAAARVIRDATPRRARLDWREKGASDFVTEVDVGAEQAAMEVIRRAEPQAQFVAEESTGSGLWSLVSGLHFVIDPLDGTTNFLHGLPEYAVSVGVVLEGALAAGVVLQVPRDEWFTAFAGGGAWLGDERLHTSTVYVSQRALIGTGFPFKTLDDIPNYLPQMERVMRATSGVRRPGAAAVDLAHVAAGRLDGFWENYLSPWDVAAGILLIREAGGVCTDEDGRDAEVRFGAIVAGNPVIHKWLLSTLHGG